MNKRPTYSEMQDFAYEKMQKGEGIMDIFEAIAQKIQSPFTGKMGQKAVKEIMTKIIIPVVIRSMKERRKASRGSGLKLAGSGPKKKSKWNNHVAAVAKKHKGKKFKEIVAIAKQSYKK